MSSNSDIVIVGGGVIGLTTAYFLAESGASVTVFDKGQVGREASWAGAGILPPAEWKPGLDPIGQFRAASVQMFPRLSDVLRERTGIDNEYRVCGGIELLDAPDIDDEEWRSGGLPVARLDGARLREAEPLLAENLGSAYLSKSMAQVRNPRHLLALESACERLGVRIETDQCVRRFRSEGERILAVETEGGDHPCGSVIVAAGAWSDSLLELVGWAPGIRPIRGQMALLDMGTPRLRHILLWGRQYLVPRSDGLVLVGSTEEDVGFRPTTTAVQIRKLLDLATAVVPALGEAALERCWAGLRPGSRDGFPFLGRVPEWSNLWVGAGHFRSGIMLSPATGWVLAKMVEGGEATLPLGDGWERETAFDVSVFRLDR